MQLEKRLVDIMRSNEELIEDLQLIQQLKLPNWWIAAGYVRNYVWDYLHGHEEKTKLNDVDVIYYDPINISIRVEEELEARLKEKKPAYQWSIKNQARMHLKNNDQPFESVEDSMKRWPETATAVGITLNEMNGIEVIAPHGLDDLFNLVVRKSKFFADEAYYRQRVISKKWSGHWTKLIFD